MMMCEQTQPASPSVEPERLLAFLQNPASYLHHPPSVTVLQTHASYAVLAPPFVYKVKKAVTFDFLDFSTLEKRRFFCHRELELNRRLCPQIYLGVVDIVCRNGALAFAEAERRGTTVEYAVKMKQLDERYFLGRLIENDAVAMADIDRIVRKLVPFYLEQAPREEVTRNGRVATLEEVTGKNLEEAEAFVGKSVDASTLSGLSYFNRRFLEGQVALLESRLDSGWIKDCHGDLHREHVHLGPECVCIYDCIEFNDQFRYIDVAADVAFLAMDLDYCHRPGLGRYFIERMASKLGDEDMWRLVDFYKAYRAAVRGKVESLRGGEQEVPDDRREAGRQAARRYFQLALSYAALGSTPAVVVVMGRIASGKSTLATALGRALGLQVLSSDRVRKELAGVALTQRPDATERKALYTGAMSERTYGRMTEMACERCRAGESVILDATFGRKLYRDRLRHAVEPLGAHLTFFELTLEDEVARQRLRQREGQAGVVSDARLEDFDALADRYEAPRELTREHARAFSADRPLDGIVEDILRHLVDSALQRNREGSV